MERIYLARIIEKFAVLSFQHSPRMSTLPRTLAELLSGLDDVPNILSNGAYKDIDKIIAQSHWMKEFQTYLRKRKLEDAEQILQFLILVEIVLQYEKLIVSDKCRKNTGLCEQFKGEQRQVFGHIMTHYFSEESENQISLSNQKLFDLLSTYAENSGSGERLTEDMLSHLKKARDDSNVWSAGLDPVYMNFLKTRSMNTSVIACLLSIL